ncbi:hypothetical protein FIU93_06535 [Labrenzia sp. THAF35]|uniref:hypothetical protein n=1 Tax=Labrenzia sp. THAF35 TaxID=2587854 RepID=UPI00126973E2|nr:hypothetical protein [Labrenzia sp. THAF35]QFT66426.1 hypothetical protein FIU93_06535 [Labrenzia sp. THAF35]
MSKSEIDHSMRGTAVLAACIVQTLAESDPSFQERFLERLAAAYREFRDDTEGSVDKELTLFSWTRSLLTGFDFLHGQGDSFLSDYDPKR